MDTFGQTKEDQFTDAITQVQIISSWFPEGFYLLTCTFVKSLTFSKKESWRTWSTASFRVFSIMAHIEKHRTKYLEKFSFFSGTDLFSLATPQWSG